MLNTTAIHIPYRPDLVQNLRQGDADRRLTFVA